MTISARLAWRNLWRNSRRTWLTVGAIMFSNIILVFLVSVQTANYQLMIENSLGAFTGHLQVQHDGYLDDPKLRSTVPDAASLAQQLRNDLSTEKVSARAMAFVLASSAERSFGLQVIGVQPETEPRVSTIPGLIKQGRYLTHNNAEEIIIGTVLARNLRVDVGDEITLLGSGLDGSFAAAVVTVAGIFDAGMIDLNRSMAQLPLGYFQTMFGMGNAGHSVVVAAPNLKQAALWHSQVTADLADQTELVVLDWDTLLPGVKQAIQADLGGAGFIYCVLLVLIAFSVLNTQLMSVLERTREFGTMLALGVTPGRLSRLVLTETAMLAGLGMVLGMLCGWLLVLYLQQVGFAIPGAEDVAQRFNLPHRIRPRPSLFSIMIGPGIIFIGSLLAALYPALRLFRLQPVPAMRAA